jgi:lipopolysaccharide transport system ATP-binding protein
MRPIIRVDNLGKEYRIGGPRAPYKTLRESISEAVRKPLSWLRTQRKFPDSTFWALKDVNFEIMPGEVVGIIGRNGAGKSTLLKVLSRITEPTNGQVELYGRVGSLLEVGTGFHPELTGRENIYLNGTILGMRRAEIARLFDEIVAFAEVEQFLDTPVKRYSSGMYVRLAFSVAAHMETEILFIDEVLAVGDTAFQKKCLGKLGDAALLGRTVLFVSHNISTILRLCQRAILLDKGRVVADGLATKVATEHVHAAQMLTAERSWVDPATAPGDETARLKAVRVISSDGKICDSFDIRNPVLIQVEYNSLRSNCRTTVSLHLINEAGITAFVTNDFNNREWWRTPRSKGQVTATCRIPGNFLAEGRFYVLAAVCNYDPDIVHALEQDAVSFQVYDQSEGDGVRGDYARTWPGIVRPMLEWNITTCSDNS